MREQDGRRQEYWRQRLKAVHAQLGLDRIDLGIWQQGEMLLASMPDESARKPELYPVFCITKLFTATLIALQVARSKLEFDDLARTLLPVPTGSRAEELLGDITVSQLLCHSHGLVEPAANNTVHDPLGRIDETWLMTLLDGCSRSFSPGRYYSYGRLGYLLLGMILERQHARPMAQVLWDEILSPLGTGYLAEPGVVSSIAVCPANGTGLSLPVAVMTRFIALMLGAGVGKVELDQQLLKEVFKPRIAPPGWSPTIRGNCHGWRLYDHGWYGHNGASLSAMLYLRLNPRQGTGICLAAKGELRALQALVPMLLLHDFPDLMPAMARQPPRMQSMDLLGSHEIQGRYQRAEDWIEVVLRPGGLTIRFGEGNDSSTIIAHECLLFPAQDRLFYLSRPFKNKVFVQLIEDEVTGTLLLWDHEQLWHKQSGG